MISNTTRHDGRKAMMIFRSMVKIIGFACALGIAMAPAPALARMPAYYHYYYIYPNNMTWCGELVREVFKNTDRNWRFTRKKVKSTAATFSVGEVRGSLRCLAKQSNASWVVITTTGNDSRKTKYLFEELRLGICGTCSALAD
jgi:hypothetical protein